MKTSRFVAKYATGIFGGLATYALYKILDDATDLYKYGEVLVFSLGLVLPFCCLLNSLISRWNYEDQPLFTPGILILTAIFEGLTVPLFFAMGDNNNLIFIYFGMAIVNFIIQHFIYKKAEERFLIKEVESGQK